MVSKGWNCVNSCYLARPFCFLTQSSFCACKCDFQWQNCIYINSLWLSVVGFHFQFLTGMAVCKWLQNCSVYCRLAAQANQKLTLNQPSKRQLQSSVINYPQSVLLSGKPFNLGTSPWHRQYVLMTSFLLLVIDGRFWFPVTITTVGSGSCVNDIHGPTGTLFQFYYSSMVSSVYLVSYSGYVVWIISGVTNGNLD